MDSNPVYWSCATWKAANDDSSISIPDTHMGDLDKDLVLSLSGPTLAVADILKLNYHLEDLALVLFLSLLSLCLSNKIKGKKKECCTYEFNIIIYIMATFLISHNCTISVNLVSKEDLRI